MNGAIKPHGLIDGDVFAYIAAVASEKAVCFDGDNTFMLGSLEDAKRIFASKIEDIKRACRLNDFTIALSDEANFRKEIFPSYKSNRTKPKPLVLKDLRSWIMDEYMAMKRPSLEADDVLGILATSKVIIKNPRKIIVSIDKDMLTIPGEYYDIGQDKLHRVSYEEAARRHMLQTLTGDSVDGYGGCPGAGPKKAEKILTDCGDYKTMWQAVLGAYKSCGLTEKDALIQARMARILRNYDYNFKTREVIPWDITKEQDHRFQKNL